LEQVSQQPFKNTRENFVKEVEAKGKGWKIEENNLDFRRQDCTLWYNTDTVVSLSKEGFWAEIIPSGDIRIYGKKDSTEFVYKGGNPRGELTNYLRKNGEWENNNWFEVGVFRRVKQPNGDFVLEGGPDPEVAYNLNQAVSLLLDML